MTNKTMSTANPLRFLPPGLEPGRFAACLGLVSDTHAPERCPALPPALFSVLAGVDLVLHAGDVGELKVLDRLSTLAPVIAVHGNDDAPEAQRELPYQQIVTVAGTRLLLTHSHYPDRAEELAQRKNDAWAPKLARWAARAERAGATVFVSGHTHVPVLVRHEATNVLLVNPGAIASPNYLTRQAVQSVALLFVRDDAAPFVTHVDLARPDHRPDQPFTPHVVWEHGFRAAHDRFTASILSPELAAVWDKVNDARRAAPKEAWETAMLRAATPCWTGEREAVTGENLLAELDREPGFPAHTRARVADSVAGR